jgi:probable rRNA maturation factor
MIDVDITDPAWSAALPDAVALVQLAAAAALPTATEDSEGVAILLTDDDSVRQFNARFRGKAAATNVLSFPAPDNMEGHLGDIALAYGVVSREAQEQGKSLSHHLQHLVVHGALHLIGYDHETDEDAGRMEALERELLAALGVPDPYAAVGDEGDHVQR